MKQYKLFIDESGKPHHKHQSRYFIQVGCLIEDGKQEDIKIGIDQIKFKYWGKTNIVFHSEEIGKKVKSFSILRDPKVCQNFEKDLFQLLGQAPFHLLVRVSDKSTMVNWKPSTIVLKSTNSLFMDYIAFLYSKGNPKGRIVFEASSFDQDRLYLQAFTQFLYPSWMQNHPEFNNVREKLTSLTFATKLNHDNEMQVADLLGYAAVCKVKKGQLPDYEKKLVKLFDQKILKKPKNVGAAKRKYYKNFKGFEIMKGRSTSN